MSLFWKRVKNRIFHRDFYSPTERTSNYREKGAQVGENVYIYGGGFIDVKYANLLSIGNNVCISQNVTILLHDASTKEHFGNSGDLAKLAEVSIGNNVFVGWGAIILPGTVIEDDCIIGAGAVVRGRIPRNSIVTGNPATVVGKRDEYIKKHKERALERPSEYEL